MFREMRAWMDLSRHPTSTIPMKIGIRMTLDIVKCH